jgi:hypothetical protein
MEGVREGATEFLGFEPIAVLGDMSNAFSDCARLPLWPRLLRGPAGLSAQCRPALPGETNAHRWDACAADVCDAGDAIEAALKQQPELAGDEREIEQVRAGASRLPSTARRFPTPYRALPQGVNRWLMKMQRAGDSSFDRFESRAMEESFHIPHDLQLVRWPSASFQRVAPTHAPRPTDFTPVADRCRRQVQLGRGAPMMTRLPSCGPSSSSAWPRSVNSSASLPPYAE